MFRLLRHPALGQRCFSQIKATYTSSSKNALYKKSHYSKPEKTAEEAVNNILYNTPVRYPPEAKRHLINCLVRNEPGVLSRISSILAARDFNIESIICAKTDISELSRMTIVLNESSSTVKQAIRQLEDLVPVWAVLDYTGSKILERELLMAKISLFGNGVEKETAEVASTQAPLQSQTTLLALSELTKLFQGRIIDVSPDNIVIELSAKCQRIDAFLALIKPYGIIEAARSGSMIMSRSTHSDYVEEVETTSQPQVDMTSLPPG
ncbi:acetolactate synthase, regulatory subunit [Entomophthora muscae]|uniref:Acetolactate synthase, regulatory subunit n=1 Tax=Entomophthora muscae TaxID=34485 RepID=A0ACC2T575_9FUNG|nr:acetolactate synthase, regulatory subunit [Entomophthora muscae]